MKIAIVGTGALGSYYGAKLCRDTHETHFLLRSDFDHVRRQGIEIVGDTESFRVRPKSARTPEEIGPCDLVLIGLKTTANSEFPRLLPPLVGPHTAILTLQNGLGNEEALARLFPVEQVLGGLCFVSLNRISPGVIRHINGGRILFGEFQRWPEPRTHDLATLFRHAGIPCQVADNLARAHWLKLVWNIPFNGLGVAGVAGYEAVAVSPSEPSDPQVGGPVLATDTLLGDVHWAALVRELMQEVIATANALGHAIESGYADAEIERTHGMGRYLASTLIDFERGTELELESLFLEPLRQARAAGVPVPRLEAVCRVLTGLAVRRGRS
ncbi:MAG TPA: 2-dehydropantoate 2-reductase [Candidatus Limnocylindria bacterium]|nr:2-dehydropantoate 2-reductase [Candidatus Limnocylindria bacterium]